MVRSHSDPKARSIVSDYASSNVDGGGGGSAPISAIVIVFKLLVSSLVDQSNHEMLAFVTGIPAAALFFFLCVCFRLFS